MILISEIISVALEPTICAPRILFWGLTNILINPSVELTATAFPFATKKDLATLNSIFFLTNSCSVAPIDATSGFE